MVQGKKLSDKTFDVFNLIFMLGIIFLTLYPFWYAVIGSFNEGPDYMRGGVNLLPRKFTLENYVAVLSDPRIMSAFKVSIGRTLIGTFFHLFVTSLFSYGFSKKNLMGKNIYAAMCIFTMFFGGGLIPYYFVLKQVHLIDNFLVYIIPAAFSFFDALIFTAFFREIPEALIESAKIDGASEYTIYFRIIIPLSMPILAALALFHAVHQWNSFFDAMLFTTKDYLQPVQLYLMKIIRGKDAASAVASRAAEYLSKSKVNSVTLQMAAMTVTITPIILTYPFLQKYFVKGILIGSVKG